MERRAAFVLLGMLYLAGTLVTVQAGLHKLTSSGPGKSCNATQRKITIRVSFLASDIITQYGEHLEALKHGRTLRTGRSNFLVS
ncbi:hypothetical protein EAI_11319 [Harpegnathos saltator]|uniref:Uncharacterized protein n=1 Tax=Harpegnathos saltator TaxID=610380 RepID=E2C003_HARSA|nr:hypothetical protein EAI_11319 [Harpegnathos saltator]